jgi:hypothetical protein
MPNKRYTGSPMTLGNMRANGVRSQLADILSQKDFGHPIAQE